jgi:hypothetical protein
LLPYFFEADFRSSSMCSSCLAFLRCSPCSDEKKKNLKKLAKIATYMKKLEATILDLADAVGKIPAVSDPKEGNDVSSYYHFDSSGKKTKNKWDSFDVDAECQKVDSDEGVTRMQAPQACSAISALSKQIYGVESELEAVLTYIDRVQSAGDVSIKDMRKKLAVEVTQSLLPKVDQLKQQCSP